MLLCRICGPTDRDDANEKGWWCCDCDSFNYWDSAMHNQHRFTLVLEDKTKQESAIQVELKLKKQLSPLRYPGGKSKMINYLSTLIRPTKCKTLISPFVGGGSFELALLDAGIVERLVINDLDYGVYALWWTILHAPDELIARIEHANPTHEDFFAAQQLIQTDYRYLTLLEAAWITLLVNRLAFSGIPKANPLGGKNGTTEQLQARWTPKTLIKRIRRIYTLADRIDVHCEDAASFIEDRFWCDDATLFVDPPYYEKGKVLYNLFFTEEHHNRLSDILQTIHTGFPSADVIVTYDFHPFIDDLYTLIDNREVIGRNYCI